MKYCDAFLARFGQRAVFTIRDARVFLRPRGISNAYLHQLIHAFLKKGTLKRLGRGVYTFQDELLVAGFSFSPFYYGLQEALSLHGLWGQQTAPVVVTPRKVRSGVRAMLGANVLVPRIRPRMFFGFAMKQAGALQVPVSSVEKTLLDFAYFREYLPPRALQALKARLRPRALQACLEKAPPRAAKRVQRWVAGRAPRTGARTGAGRGRQGGVRQRCFRPRPTPACRRAGTR